MADIGEQDSIGLTELIRAALNGHIDKVIYLLKNNDKYGTLMCAIASNALDKAFLTAVGSKDMEAAEILVNAGANVDAQDERGNTALMNAIWTHRTDIAKELRTLGARKDIRNNDGETAQDLERDWKFMGLSIYD